MKVAKIFGTDGVRGRAGTHITPTLCIDLGIAAGLYFRELASTSKTPSTNKILLGKDTRRSGYMIENALVSALTSVGYDVIQVGPMPTPAIAFLTADMRCDAGIMISASHNPYDDNGIKFFDRFGCKLDENAESAIEKIYHQKDLLARSYKTGREIGSSKRIDDVIGRYIVHIKNSFPKELTLQGLRVVLDCANGAAYKVAPTIFGELGADVVVMNDEPNGFNINEQCGAMHPQDLANEVIKYRADIGFALDGDADRLVVVDDSGAIVGGDMLIGALGAYLKSIGELESDTIVATQMSNLALEEYLKSQNLTLARCDVGDKYVFDMMKKTHSNFGGEQSGHIIFSDYSTTGDGLMSAIQVMALVLRARERSGAKAHEVLSPFTLYPQKLINIAVNKKPPLESIAGYDKLCGKLADSGMRSLIRYSGTENKLRVLIEGKDESALKQACKEAEEFFCKALG
ncbi:phosphoglucosamine mutase [Helicobacter sp. CLO-3]|uniref:phosphoglucosamine mutase n=1 Tax=unclassified Helicobacter TaxID=2593540 RepID=UPI000804D4EC|nr:MULTISPECIES: phosphoglucosamine mutase [unclassified Helicobacter]OBV30124.1 phosphoglucosamine mutase [Helicobacter sp. CLO-3]OHU83532.1 phosphoglucosamine mutase [Helicobacter sp. CLO-3]